MKNVGRIQVVPLRGKGWEGDIGGGDDAVCFGGNREGRRRRTVETSGALASVLSRDNKRGIEKGIERALEDGGVLALKDRDDY